MFWISKKTFARTIADAVGDLHVRLIEAKRASRAFEEEKRREEKHAKCHQCNTLFHREPGIPTGFCSDKCREEGLPRALLVSNSPELCTDVADEIIRLRMELAEATKDQEKGEEDAGDEENRMGWEITGGWKLFMPGSRDKELGRVTIKPHGEGTLWVRQPLDREEHWVIFDKQEVDLPEGVAPFRLKVGPNRSVWWPVEPICRRQQYGQCPRSEANRPSSE